MTYHADGGPAFPPPILVCVPIEPEEFARTAAAAPLGMTLRDHFAGEAIKHMRYHGLHVEDPEIRRSAWQAYRLADAMLEARKHTSAELVELVKADLDRLRKRP